MKAIAILSFVVLLGSFLSRPILDPDIWWHINVGRWIVAHGEVPRVDYWNTFAAGTPWRAYSWSNEVVYALADNLYGHTGLAVLQLLLGLAFALAAHLFFSSLAQSHFLGALITALTIGACRGHFSLRPQTTVWIVFILLLWCAELYQKRANRLIYLLGVFALGCIWANSHLSAIFGLVGMCLWLLRAPVNRDDLVASGKLALVFFIGTLITPYLGGEWLTLINKSDHAFAFRMIDEFHPANLVQAPTAVLMFQVVALLVLSVASNKIPRLGGLMLATINLTVGLVAVKFSPFASIAIGALTAAWLGEVLSEGKQSDENNLLRGLRIARDKLHSLQPQTIGALGFFLGCFAWINSAKAINHPIAYSKTPKRAVDFIEEKSLAHPILNEFESGGYLQYRWSSRNGDPKFLTPIDGRTNVNRSDIWEDYREAFTGNENWRSYFKKVNPRTVIWRKGSPLTTLLLEDPAWCRVFDAGSNPNGYGVFITREDFDNRPSEFASSDCKAEGLPNKQGGPDQGKSCKDMCGDGTCQEMVCMAVGCPCPETKESCPADCK